MKRFALLAVAAALALTSCGDATSQADTTMVPATTAASTDSSPATAPAGATTPTEVADGTDPIAVELQTADGLMLDATVYPGDARWVVLAHMLPADKESWNGLAIMFQAQGYSVLTYNNRGYGDSDGTREPFRLGIDAAAAIGHAFANGATEIVFGGASMNGATAMTLGASGDFAAIFALSAVAAFPSMEDAEARAPQIAEPILFVSAADDGSAAADADRFARAAPRGSEIRLDSGGHGTRMLEAEPDLGAQIVAWVMNPSG